MGPDLLLSTLNTLDKLNYKERFLDLFSDYFMKHFPVKNICLFYLNKEATQFLPFLSKKTTDILQPIVRNSKLISFIKSTKKMIAIRDIKASRLAVLKNSDPEIFERLTPDYILPVLSMNRLHGFIVVQGIPKNQKHMNEMDRFFVIFSNILAPQITAERLNIENDQKYYRIYRMDRLALVGELAASAAHEIKNPLAGISTTLKYFTELEKFEKNDIIDDLNIMKQSVHRVDEIIKSLLSFSKYKKKKITMISLEELIETSYQSVSLKRPKNIKVRTDYEKGLVIESDSQRLQQVLVNIFINSLDALEGRPGDIAVRTFLTGKNQLPSREVYNISVKDNGPGVPEAFKNRLFQPFQTTKEEGTGLGLYISYGLMKSLCGDIRINSSSQGTEVVLSLPYHCDEDEGEGEESL